MSQDSTERYHDRELSWLAFNARVLQEAGDPGVPLLERLKFLAIFSSNLDEFFRVRVASLRSLLRLKKKTVKQLGFNPRKLLRAIHREVVRQQRLFGEIFSNEILPALEENGICFSFGHDLSEAESTFVERYFREHVQQRLSPKVLGSEGAPFLENRAIYLVTELWPDGDRSTVFPSAPEYGMVPLYGDGLSRFVEISRDDDRARVMFLDDIIRSSMGRLFPGYDCGEVYAVKVTRDAELYLDDEFGGDLVEMIKKSLGKRDRGLPTRFLYDLRMPYPMVTALKTQFGLEDEDLVLGGQYHNYSDFFAFPDFGRSDLASTPMPPLAHPDLSRADPVLDVVARRDVLLHFPYQSFESVIRLFEEAAEDPTVSDIRITLYRVASDSRIAKALIRAATRGARVTAFVEVKARFDEEPNLRWGDEMEAAGVRVLYSLPGLKVHSKLAVITRSASGGVQHFTYLATGNFNEKTARVYTDHALITANQRFAKDALQVFDFLSGGADEVKAKSLLVAPFGLRSGFEKLIDREIANAENGKDAWILAKMNSLEDVAIIDRLYAASRAGVKVRLVVRGICRLVPGVPGLSDNIRVTSIVDRFLEHARVYMFCNDNTPELFLASADWMTRNLDRRVEIAFPVADDALRSQLEDMLLVQCRDNRKARIVDDRMRNRYVTNDEPRCRAQLEIYQYVAGLSSARAPRATRVDWEAIAGSAGQN